MKLSSVVVWFNPDGSAVENVAAYSSLCEKIYIVDNSETDNSALAKKIQNAVYLPNFKNLGIAQALNVGCGNAVRDGFEWCMTMDQDSSWEISVLQDFLTELQKMNDEKIASFAPVHSNEVKSVVGEIKHNAAKKNSVAYVFQDKVMTSGNIINLSVWQQVGKFNEDLFIDEVDHEFCYRLLENGYKICEFKDILMRHTLGCVKKTILPRPCKHSGVRLFYIFRNMLYIKSRYPAFFRKNGYKKYMVSAVIQKIFELKFSDLAYMAKGISACKKNIFGSFDNYVLETKKPENRTPR